MAISKDLYTQKKAKEMSSDKIFGVLNVSLSDFSYNKLKETWQFI